MKILSALCFLLFGSSLIADDTEAAAHFEAEALKLEGSQKKSDSKKWVKLADFAESRRLWKERTKALESAVKLNKSDAISWQRLRHVKTGKTWIPLNNIIYRKKNHIYYGNKWLKPDAAVKALAKDQKALGWDFKHRIDTNYVKIYSSRPLDYTLKMSHILDSHVVNYMNEYGKIWKLKKPKGLIVYLIEDRPTFDKLVSKVKSGSFANLEGFYSIKSKILFCGPVKKNINATDDRSLYSDSGESYVSITNLIVHELTHGLDHQCAGISSELAPWILEGRANYYGSSVSDKEVLPGSLKLSYGDSTPETLDTGHLSISQLFGMNVSQLSGADIQRNYVYSQAAITFLFHGQNHKYADRFRVFLKGMLKKHSKADFEKVVGPLATIDQEFKDYVKYTFRPAALKARSVKK